MFIKKIKVVPYIKTTGDEDFKFFITGQFSVNHLYTILNDNTINTVFAEWYGKNMGNWFKIKNDDGVILEFYSTEYVIKPYDTDKKYTLTIPLTINDFINDMNKYNIPLYWSKWVYITFEPKQYMAVDEICDYYRELLTKMKKSHELL